MSLTSYLVHLPVEDSSILAHHAANVFARGDISVVSPDLFSRNLMLCSLARRSTGDTAAKIFAAVSDTVQYAHMLLRSDFRWTLFMCTALPETHSNV